LGRLAPNVALVATGFFILFKSKCNKPGKITETLATTSYGIYFVHMLVLWNVGRILKSTVIGNNLILYVIISGITTYFVSFFIVYFLSRIGFLKRFVT
jgi:peptidoglycan/LPS O-acetylase OafA/YrhL